MEFGNRKSLKKTENLREHPIFAEKVSLEFDGETGEIHNYKLLSIKGKYSAISRQPSAKNYESLASKVTRNPLLKVD